MAESFGRQWWQWALEEFPSSGLTVAEFCRRHGCAVPTFYAWRRRLAEEQNQERPAFAELIVQHSEETDSLIEIQLSHGTSVRLRGRVNEANLRSVLQVLGESSC